MRTQLCLLVDRYSRLPAAGLGSEEFCRGEEPAVVDAVECIRSWDATCILLFGVWLDGGVGGSTAIEDDRHGTTGDVGYGRRGRRDIADVGAIAFGMTLLSLTLEPR